MDEWKFRDPLAAFPAELRERGLLDDGALAALDEDVAKEVANAVAFAEAGTWEPVEDLIRDVHTERSQ